MLAEFRPEPDAKITECGEAPILGAENGLPDRAKVLLAEVKQAMPREGFFQYCVGVQPEGCQAVWLGTKTIEPVYLGGTRRAADNIYGIEPDFNHPENNASGEGRLRWLSTNPPLLLITASDYMGEGTALHVGGHDTLVYFEGPVPRVVLHESILLSGKGGFSVCYSGGRKISSSQSARGVEVTFVDSKWICEELDEKTPLHPLYGPDPIHGEENVLCWFGDIETRRTRTWLFAEGNLTLEAEKLEYRVQDGDTWEDIAIGFLKNAKYEAEIRNSNPQYKDAATPEADSWIVIPGMPAPKE